MREQFDAGAGNELRGDPCAGQALHSSASLAINVFHYWRTRGDLKTIAEACKIPAAHIKSLAFEKQLKVMDPVDRGAFPIDPHLDVLIEYGSKAKHRAVGIECKFTEAYSSRGHGSLKPAYLEHEKLWEGLPALRAFAETLVKNDTTKHLHPAQLVKHILGLRHGYGHGRFRLLYLWYAVPHAETAVHQAEIEEFKAICDEDGIKFQATTYQSVIQAMYSKGLRSMHTAYVDYLAERYL